MIRNTLACFVLFIFELNCLFTHSAELLTSFLQVHHTVCVILSKVQNIQIFMSFFSFFFNRIPETADSETGDNPQNLFKQQETLAGEIGERMRGKSSQLLKKELEKHGRSGSREYLLKVSFFSEIIHQIIFFSEVIHQISCHSEIYSSLL